jgi:hypothetical protein
VEEDADRLDHVGLGPVLHHEHDRPFERRGAGQDRVAVEVVEILRDGSRFRNEGAVVELEHRNDARRVPGQERRLLVLCRDEVDRHPFDLGFEPLRGDDGTHPDRVWEALAIIDFHNNLLRNDIYLPIDLCRNSMLGAAAQRISNVRYMTSIAASRGMNPRAVREG